jgi:hypothetical protein
MSWQATAHIKELMRCPDGAPMSRGQKLLALILADYHNTHYKAAFPSVLTLAKEAFASHAQTKRDLAYLEEHGVIQKVRPEKMGRGWVCAYQFPLLDSQKGAHNEPFFSAQESRSKGAHVKHETGSEVAQKGLTASGAIRKNKEPEQLELETCGTCGGEKLIHVSANVQGPRLIPCPKCHATARMPA